VVFFVKIADKVGDDFCIGFAAKGAALFEKPFLEGGIVFNDAVMDDGDFSGVIEMGVGVDLIGAAMSSPAGVPNPNHCRGNPSGEHFLEIADSSGAFGEMKCAVFEQGNSRRVITAVFETFETFNKNRLGRFIPEVRYNSTHIEILSKGSKR